MSDKWFWPVVLTFPLWAVPAAVLMVVALFAFLAINLSAMLMTLIFDAVGKHSWSDRLESYLKILPFP